MQGGFIKPGRKLGKGLFRYWATPEQSRVGRARVITQIRVRLFYRCRGTPMWVPGGWAAQRGRPYRIAGFFPVLQKSGYR